MIDIDDQIIERQECLNNLQKERQDIENKLKNLKVDAIEHDFLDELVRDKLGMSDPNDKVIIINY